MPMRSSILLAMILSLIAWNATALALDYERDIMPIFEEKCFDCHSAEADKVKGGLRLDDPERFFARFAKNDVVIPGNWDASYLFVTITRPHEAKEAMPPKGKGTPLTPEEIMTVASWIHEGARVGRERGEEGPDDYKPEDFLKFKDGVLLTDGFVAEPGDTPESAPASMPEATPRLWTNREGREITATFKGLDGDKAILLLENGQTVPYPLAMLSDESQAEILKLSGDAPAAGTNGGEKD